MKLEKIETQKPSIEKAFERLENELPSQHIERYAEIMRDTKDNTEAKEQMLAQIKELMIDKKDLLDNYFA